MLEKSVVEVCWRRKRLVEKCCREVFETGVGEDCWRRLL